MNDLFYGCFQLLIQKIVLADIYEYGSAVQKVLCLRVVALNTCVMHNV